MIRGIWTWLRIVFFSLRWVPRIHLGDRIWYQGRQYNVANGVRPEMWRLHGLGNEDEGWVLRAECRKVRTLGNYLGTFRSGYEFYMGYWYDIWKRQGIEPWVRALSIW